MSYHFVNVASLICSLAEEGQRIEDRGDLQNDIAAIARGRAFLEIAARLEDTHIGATALSAQPLMDAEALTAAHLAIVARLRGALASIVADPDCCAASKAIAKDGLRRPRAGGGERE